MGLGLEDKIARMDKKLKQIYEYIIMIGIIGIIIYGLVVFILGHHLNFMSFLQSSDFVSVIIGIFFLYVVWKLLKGGTIKVPEKPKGQKTTFNIPNPYAVQSVRQGQTPITRQRQQPKPQPKVVNSPVIRGSWKCPKCEFLVVATSRCPKCGFQRRR